MSYYILPKKITELTIDPLISVSPIPPKPYISFSLYNYLNNINKQLVSIQNNDTFFLSINEDSLSFLNEIINPYEFIFTKVPNSKLSVSKLKPFSNSFYILMEIIHIFNLLDSFIDKNINTLSYGFNSNSIIECMNMLREDKNDINIKSNIDIPHIRTYGCDITESFRSCTYDFLYYELNDDDYKNNNYITGMIYILCNLLCYQNSNGVSIIKIDNIFDKPTIDILYILSTIYEKVYIIKPNIVNVTSNERYIICKNFICNLQKIKLYYTYFINLDLLIKNIKQDEQLITLLKDDLPYYFLNKIEESNIIIGHQQLEYIDQLINLHNNKNKDDKINILKKNNIQKCIQWCEKFKIPYNKFTDKVNIFLNGEKINDNINIFLSSKSDHIGLSNSILDLNDEMNIVL
jgi:hypothetical protein